MLPIIKFNVIAAACENMGIGVNQQLPWDLKNEMTYFNKMTTITVDRKKRNAIIMGRHTWDSMPKNQRPFPQRLNIVLTKQSDPSTVIFPDNVNVAICNTFQQAIEMAASDTTIEKIWIIGGSTVYKKAMDHPNCHKIYLTEIHKTYECDTFFPPIPDRFKLLSDHDREYPSVPINKQIENDVQYYFRIYETCL